MIYIQCRKDVATTFYTHDSILRDAVDWTSGMEVAGDLVNLHSCDSGHCPVLSREELLGIVSKCSSKWPADRGLRALVCGTNLGMFEICLLLNEAKASFSNNGPNLHRLSLGLMGAGFAANLPWLEQPGDGMCRALHCNSHELSPAYRTILVGASKDFGASIAHLE
jgi:hypothetical protein